MSTELDFDAVFKALANPVRRAICDELGRTDARDEKHQRDSAGDLFLADLAAVNMWCTYGPSGAPIAAWVEHDVHQLAELASRRRAS